MKIKVVETKEEMKEEAEEDKNIAGYLRKLRGNRRFPLHNLPNSPGKIGYNPKKK